jgi:hypothetical protein
VDLKYADDDRKAAFTSAKSYVIKHNSSVNKLAGFDPVKA